MIYLSNNTRSQVIAIPRSDGTAPAVGGGGSSAVGTYSRAELDAKFAALAQQMGDKVNSSELGREAWNFETDDGQQIAKEIAVWTSEE